MAVAAVWSAAATFPTREAVATVMERDWDNLDEHRWNEQTAEIRKIYAANQAHQWNASTTVVQAIRDRLVADRDDR